MIDLMFILLSSLAEDDDTCYVCGAKYWEETENEQRAWIGCDGNCGKWCHYHCAGYKWPYPNKHGSCMVTT